MKNRTIIGIVCMILAVAMTFAIAPVVNRLTSDTTTVVRLKQEVGRGTKITEDQVETVKVKTDTMPQGVYVKTADVVGKYASSTLYAGDILTKAKLSGDSNNADDVLAPLNGSKVLYHHAVCRVYRRQEIADFHIVYDICPDPLCRNTGIYR